MAVRKIEEWDVDDVCTWLNAIGLGDKTGPFRDEDVDGALLVDLEEDDLKDDLGLSGLQYKKFRRCLEFAQKVVEAKREAGESGDVGEKVTVLEHKITDLECSLEAKDKTIQQKDERIRELEAALAGASQPPAVAPPPPAPAPTPPPAPAPAPTPPPAEKPPPKEEPPKSSGAPVVKEAAGGAARGAVGGAVLGAVAPNMTAGDGAKAGAATGATLGGMRGLREKRAQRRGR